MSTKPRTNQERTAPTPADIRQKDHIGIDTDEMDHYLDRVRQTIYVLDGEEIVHREDVTERTVGDWVDYVAAARGWTECHYASDLRTLLERAGVL
jgi:hypothetical protein